MLILGGKGASGVAVLGDLHEFPVHPLELWGQICCQLAAQPKDMFRDIRKGPIKIEVCILYLTVWSRKHGHIHNNSSET